MAKYWRIVPCQHRRVGNAAKEKSKKSDRPKFFRAKMDCTFLSFTIAANLLDGRMVSKVDRLDNNICVEVWGPDSGTL